MPWTTPTLQQLRQLNANNIIGKLSSAPLIPNSSMRVMADANAGLCYLELLYLAWQANQYLPDTSETEWLDRHASIWLGGRKPATFASGQVSITGVAGTIVPLGTQVGSSGTASGANVLYQTTQQATIGVDPTPVAVVAITAGADGNLAPGSPVSFAYAVSGVDALATVINLYGGADQETDDEVRARVLFRIRQPPMGGSASDYVAWATSFPGVTRAWCSPLEMGMGTVSVRFMMDDLRSTDDPMTNGFPLPADVTALTTYMNALRPVAVKDFFVLAPIPEPIDFTIINMNDETNSGTQQAIITNVTSMLHDKAAPAYAINGVAQPAQTIYAAWVSDAVLNTQDVEYFDLAMADHPMPSNGSLAVMGTATFP